MLQNGMQLKPPSASAEWLLRRHGVMSVVDRPSVDVTWTRVVGCHASLRVGYWADPAFKS